MRKCRIFPHGDRFQIAQTASGLRRTDRTGLPAAAQYNVAFPFQEARRRFAARQPVMTVLILGLIVFLGEHSIRIIADDWRSAQLKRLGEGAWKGIYSVISI